ncbi:MAG: pyridoxamine 5'-phosphate oxidase [Acidobacteria bacterium]|nr:MAG: pyridoxamine 5'-phosphate oxidase [Acidobacteriota bacterium]
MKRTRRRFREPKATRPHIPGYGLPKSRKGLLSWSWAEQRLERSHNYWISTTRKARNLAANPRCVICSERAEQAVVVEGVAELVSDRTIRKQFGELYQKKYKWDMKDFSEPIYIVRPRVAFGLFEKKFMASATRWTFE